MFTLEKFFTSGEYLRDLSIAVYAGVILWAMGIFYDRKQARRRSNEDKSDSLAEHYTEMLGTSARYLKVDESYPNYVKDEIEIRFKMSAEHFERVLESIDVGVYEKNYNLTDVLEVREMIKSVLELDHNAYQKVKEVNGTVHQMVKNIKRCKKGI
ncbi:hypothetical protein [Vagococcus intermedius]|uniref:Uncharacterized protein n=1 Tax=Vagococcus intermedius TaxID=2991418 RepID=A0AAF0I688_9ENTE|nr:hypothetical protein [Vagococcus intermedius]WEG72540.1 hypothetical protein OL234_06005 [Vagococcus intermedius]WEG74627.1 hypothetical protein OL235_06010 [Vagococcus intermedius]